MATWTSFPSLQSTLDDTKNEAALEAAVCAFACGRFAAAAEILRNKLPENHEYAIIALEKANMLNLQGLQDENVRLLKTRLEYLSGKATISGEVTLLELLLADAQYWATGTLKDSVDKARAIRDSFKSKDPTQLGDLEVIQSREPMPFPTLTNMTRSIVL